MVSFVHTLHVNSALQAVSGNEIAPILLDIAELIGASRQRMLGLSAELHDSLLLFGLAVGQALVTEPLKRADCATYLPVRAYRSVNPRAFLGRRRHKATDHSAKRSPAKSEADARDGRTHVCNRPTDAEERSPNAARKNIKSA
ncbi:hypothetical protein [Paracoccus sp. TOH]|uniref:hypothetical protein n=1 Tax=Paracoccus sp. TOH TaxID=1263728 RepID=UPI0025B1F62C|nr:hypothetical protein [Paracoccus sp. TOH]WJS87211.1 hypothetical protein NBE95_20240 [Paracoccus sp. TOH]